MLTGGESLVRYRTEQPKRVRVGGIVRVHSALEGAKLFDRETGEVLATG